MHGACSLLVCSPELLRARCHTPEQMRLVNALCRFVEMADAVGRDVARRGYADRVTEATLRDRLLLTLEAAREHEAVLLALCDDAPAAEAGRWTAKDNVAHLNTWREHAVRILDAVRAGEPLEGPFDDRQIDARNAEIYDAHRADSAAEVRAASDSHLRRTDRGRGRLHRRGAAPRASGNGGAAVAGGSRQRSCARRAAPLVLVRRPR